MMTRALFTVCLLASFAASAQAPALNPANPAPADSGVTSTAQPPPGYGNMPPPGNAITPSPGYVVTPWGTVLFPSAPPPQGDTSTLSSPGPNVTEGPELGPGPAVGPGPVVGVGP